MAFKEAQNAATNPTAASDQTQCDFLKPPEKLPCAQCRRILKTTPRVVQKKGKMNFVCSLACSQEFKKANNIIGQCEYCKTERIIKDTKRVDDKDCYFCSDGCKMLFCHDLKKKWGEHCHSCAYCLSISKTVVTARYKGTEEEFCSEDCNSKFNMLFCHVAKCDTCCREGKLRQSLPLLGEVKHFCDLKCLLHFCNNKVQIVNTDNIAPKVLPIPVPVYVPVPMNMYSQYTPKPVGLPLLYLFENGRMENIFSDWIYNKFSVEFTKILKGFRPSVTASGYIHSCVAEEFLWDCKQLGAYSPIVLLNTLLFFFCKYFGLTTVEQHCQLSFANIVRCTKTNQNYTKTHFLRFYPPISMNKPESDDDGVPAKKPKRNENKEDFLDMMENTENPLRCPVRLYEFYLSKCSDSVRQQTDLFYLHPDRCCVPNSPLWFSSTPLDNSTMEAMLVRILTVRELQEDQQTSDDSFVPEDEDSE